MAAFDKLTSYDWRGAFRKASADPSTVAFAAFFIGAALVAAAVAWSGDDDPDPTTMSRLTPTIQYVTSNVGLRAVGHDDREACRALLLWTRSQRNLDVSLQSAGVGIGVWNRAVYRCAAVGVWPTPR